MQLCRRTDVEGFEWPAGYFEAPAAATAPVAFDRHGASRNSASPEVNVPLPDVVICFCAIDGLQAMQVGTL